MVVDDNVDASETLREALRTYGHTVAVAYTPETALELFEQMELDIAILDIGLQGMTEHELAALMQRSAKNPKMLQVALSWFGQPLDKARSAAVGFAKHLVKPLRLEESEHLFNRLE